MTETQIANQALALIGQPQITGFEEQSESARQIRINFRNDLESVLSSFDWSFATVIERLALVGDIDKERYPNSSFIYLKPDHCLRIRRIRSRTSSLQLVSDIEVAHDYFREVHDNGRPVILTNIEHANIEYVKVINNSALWEPLFCESLSYKLAASIVGSLTGSTARVPELIQLYYNSLQMAKSSNANNELLPYQMPTRLTEARFMRKGNGMNVYHR
jgi:hypothetical protein